MRRGSMEYWPHRRAKRLLPRVRSWPSAKEPSFLGFAGIKIGMTHVTLIDDSESPSKGTEISRPVTLIEIPKVYLYGVRLYSRGDFNYKMPYKEFYIKDMVAKLRIKGKGSVVESMDNVKPQPNDSVRALMLADISSLHIGNKRRIRFEVAIGGKDAIEKLEFVKKYAGKEIKAADIFKPGEYVDAISISKGKGWAGVIKRYGVARLVRKATNKTRHVGTLGPWHPPKVQYTVPQAGHMGYNYRTEINKRILKIGQASEAASVNVAGGYPNYGLVKSDFIMLDGSIPGPAKRLVRLRKALRSKAQVVTPQLVYISTASKQ